MRFILTIAFMVFAVQASALPSDKIKAMVNLVGQAKGGCWTKLRETREYAEEKLRMKGIAYVLPMDTYASDEYPEFHIQNFFLTITVTAQRAGESFCYGDINIRLHSYDTLNDKTFTNYEKLYDIVRNEGGIVLYKYGNLNNDVLDTVSRFISEVE